MALWQVYAKSAIEQNREALLELPEEKRKKAIAGIATKFKTEAPNLMDEGRITPETKTRLDRYTAQSGGAYQPKGVTAGVEAGQQKWRRQAELEAYGADLDTPMPGGDVNSMRIGFGVDPKQEMSNILTEEFNTGNKVPVVQDEGEYFYIHPESKKLTRLNTPLVSKIGYSLPMAGDVVGTYGLGKTSPVGAVGGAIARETAGSGFGASGGEMLRLAIGKWAGAHDLDWDEMGERAAKVGGEAAAFTGGIGSLVAGGKGLVNMFRGGLISPKVLQEYNIPAEDAQKVIDEVNELLKQQGSSKRVRLTGAQKADDAILESYEEELERSVEYGQKFRARRQSDQEAIREAVEGQAREPHMVERGYLNVGDVAAAKTGKRVEQANQIVRQNTETLERNLDAIGKTEGNEALGERTLQHLKTKGKLSKEAEQAAWADVKAAGGYNPNTKTYGVEIPYGDDTARLRKIYKRRGDTGQTKPHVARKRGAFAEQPKGKDAPKGQDLADLNDEISDVREEIAKARLGTSKSASDVSELIELKDSLVADRASALNKMGREDLLRAIETAEKQTAAYNDVYKRSVVGELMERDARTGVAKIQSPEFVNRILKAGDEEMEQFTNVIGDNMELMDMWRQGMLKSWKDVAINDAGKYRPDAARKWVEKHRPQLEWFLSKSDLRNLEDTGNLAKKLYVAGKTPAGQPKAGQVTRLQQFKNRAQKKWGSGKLQNADPEGISKFIFGEGGGWTKPSGQTVGERIQKIKFVKNMTADNPAAWRRVQQDFKRELSEELIDPKTGYMDHNAISSWTHGKQNREVIREMLGSQYLKNLDTLKKLADLLHKSEKRLTKSQNVKATIQAIRAGAAPPLTKRGRALTALITFGNKEANRRVAESLLDDNMLREVAGLVEHNANTRRFYEKAFSLGFMLPDEQPPEE